MARKSDGTRAPHSPANLESAAADALPDAVKNKYRNQTVRIHIHSIRKRPTDSDGVSGKAAIDGIVAAGLLEDDHCEIVESVTFSQEKGTPEKTIITIEPVPRGTTGGKP